jgi:hypothetical protein
MSANARYQSVKKLIYLMLSLFIGFGMQSCGTSNNVNPAVTTTKINIIDVSPDVYSVDTYINNIKFNSALHHFNATGYVGINAGQQPLQVRTSYTTIGYSSTALFTISPTLLSNSNYSLFITGYRVANIASDSLTHIFVADTSALPAVGYGKIRFINVSPRSPGFDIYANGTKAFSNITYTKVSGFLEIPAGVYDFKVNTAGSTNVQKDIPGITVQDGHLYTIYAYGLIGTSTRDSTAFNTGLITNK